MDIKCTTLQKDFIWQHRSSFYETSVTSSKPNRQNDSKIPSKLSQKTGNSIYSDFSWVSYEQLETLTYIKVFLI